MTHPTVIIAERSMPTDGSLGSADVHVVGDGIDIQISIFIDSDSSDIIDVAISQWQAAHGVEIQPPRACACGNCWGGSV